MIDAMTGPLKSITSSMNLMIRSFEHMQNVSGRNVQIDRTLAAAKKQITSAEAEIAKQTERAKKEQDRYNRSVKNGQKSAQGLLGTVGLLAGAYAAYRGGGAIASITDQYINTRARLDLVNDGLQTTAELQDKIFKAAERARGSYTDMASVVGKMGILASEAFTGNDELIAFSELMQKSFRVGGASTMEQQAGMYQLTQAMAAGRLQGDEFRSIMENAPMLAAAIADFTGKSKGDLKDMSADGVITAEIIKGAMFSAADEINRKFATMPKTFSDIWTRMKNIALQQFEPALQRIGELLNDPTTERNIRSVGRAFADAAVMATQLLGVAGAIYNFISTNWTWVEPVIWGIVGATAAWKIAQIGLNIALAANPIGVIIMAVAALVGFIVLLVKWTINLWQTNDKFVAAIMFGWNMLLNAADSLVVGFMRAWYGVVDGAEWMYVHVQKIIQEMINDTIRDINTLIEKLSTIGGISIKAIAEVEFATNSALEAEAKKQERALKLGNLEAAASARADERRSRVFDFLDSRQAERLRREAEEAERKVAGYDLTQWQVPYDGIDSIDKVKEVGKIKDKVDISSEDLKMMRELAEMKSIQNFVTLRPQMSFGDTHVRQDGRSIDEIVANITEQLNEQIASSAKGVFGVG